MTTVPKFNCILCKESFDNKEDLQIHFRKHGDPKFNQSLKSTKRADMQSSSEKPKDQIDMVSCDVCPEMFPTISKAITHKHKVHPDHDAKYFCPWCGKLFTMKHLYNKHMQSNHENMHHNEVDNFHCDSCEVNFYVPSAVLYHNKFFHRQDTELPPIGFSKKQRLYNQELMSIYYCAFCGEEYNNKVNLHKHTGDDHSDENQNPEDVLRCPVCDAIFYHLDAYELHLTFHSSDDIYSEETQMNIDEITEYTLETVPPMMEKVEISTEDSEAMGIDQFLQMAMTENKDTEKVKLKKHKKHKKSKKAAITLDEFLSMNQDVFGEGLDFQGVEEVPTQVVNQRLKIRKKPPTEVKSNSNLEKLKKQGIVIKKSGNSSHLQGTKVNPSTTVDNIVNILPSSSQKPVIAMHSSKDMLSKLMNQSNNQLKIVKKSTQGRNIKSFQDNLQSIDDDETMSKKKYFSAGVTSGTTGQSQELLDVLETSEQNVETSNLSIKFPETNPKDITKSLENTPEAHSIDIEHFDNSDVEKDNDEQAMSEEDDNEPESEDKIKAVTTNQNKINACETSIKTLSSQITIKSLSQSDNNTKENIIDETSNNGPNESDEECSQESLASNTESASKPVNILSHLSHLTIKPVGQNKTITEVSMTSPVSESKEHDQLEGFVQNKITKVSLKHVPKSIDKNSYCKEKVIKAIKNEKTSPSTSDDDEIVKDKNTSEIKVTTTNNSPSNENDKNPLSILKNIAPEIKIKHLNQNQSKTINESSLGTTKDNIKSISADSKLMNHKTSIRPNHLPAKPSPSHFVKSDESNTDKEVEIFNIDDSDSDEHDKITSSSINSSKQNKSSHKPIIKSLPNITVNKNINEQYVEQQFSKTNIKNTSISKELYDYGNSDDDEHFDDECQTSNHKPNALAKNINKKKSDILTNVMRNLSKQITIKSRNSSPNQQQKQISQECNGIVHTDNSDQDMNLGTSEKNKEPNNEDYSNDDEAPDRDSNNSDEDHDENDFNQDDDIESKIKANHMSKIDAFKTSIKPPSIPDALKNISKNITIKSMSDKKHIINTENYNLSNADDNYDVSSNPKQRQQKKIIHSEGSQVSSSETSELGEQCASRNKTSVINKAVSVKTVQTKTVIQEITTTVTKTIRTVNQTIQQEVRQSNQSNANIIRPQKIKPLNTGTSLQQTSPPPRPTIRNAVSTNLAIGTKIRHSNPNNVKPRNPTATIRPSNQIVLARPSSQVPPRPPIPMMPTRPSNSSVRPKLNVARLSSPRMAKPPNTIQNSVPQKTLKIAPSVKINNTTKRPTQEETVGHFSCFKKPKESLFPDDCSDLSSADSESVTQFASSSHISKSNYTSTTKAVKGNSVISSTQTKSEVSSSHHQLSKMSGLSGLKIMKASQSQHQAVHTDQKYEDNVAKRSAMEAIEKLQKQGLLVKKPRPEVSYDSEPAISDAEHNENYTVEEFDDDQ